MKASDTVMSKEQIEEVKYLEMKDNPEYRFEPPIKVAREVQDKAIAKAQAQITAPIFFNAGIKEVVEWIEKESMFGIPKALTIQSQKDWKAKLKEWGIE